MTDEVPADWVLIEAAKRGAFRQATIEEMRMWYPADKTYRALCDALIAPPIEPPVDRKLLCAREAVREWRGNKVEALALRAIELWEEGFGK